MNIPTITVQQLHEALFSPNAPQVLDVREDSEIATVALPNITHIPLGQLAEALATGTSKLNTAQPVAVICKSGGRSAMATAMLLQEGFTAANVQGGMLAWVSQVDPSLPTP